MLRGRRLAVPTLRPGRDVGDTTSRDLTHMLGQLATRSDLDLLFRLSQSRSGAVPPSRIVDAKVFATRRSRASDSAADPRRVSYQDPLEGVVSVDSSAVGVSSGVGLLGLSSGTGSVVASSSTFAKVSVAASHTYWNSPVCSG